MVQFFNSCEVTLNNVAINNSDNYGAYLYQNAYQITHSNVTFSNNRQGNVYDARTSPAVVRTNLP